MKRSMTLSLAAVFGLAFFIAFNVASACGGSSGSSKMGSTDAAGTATAKAAGAEAAEDGSYPAGSDKVVSTVETAKNAASEEDFVLARFAVKGMTCTGCEGQVKQALSAQKGVTEVVEVCHKSEKAIVKYDPNVVEPGELVSAMTKVGYKAEVVPAVAETPAESHKEVSKDKDTKL